MAGNAAFNAFILGPAASMHFGVAKPTFGALNSTQSPSATSTVEVRQHIDSVRRLNNPAAASPTGSAPSIGEAGQDDGETGVVKGSRKTRRDKQTTRACSRCRLMKLKCDSGRPCIPCIRKGCAANCVDWDWTRALCRKLDDDSSQLPGDWVDCVERPIRWKPSSTTMNSCDDLNTLDGQGVGLESFLGSPPREFLAHVMKKLFTANRISDWMHAFCDEVVDSLTEYVKASAMQSQGIRQTFKMKGVMGTRRFVVGNQPELDIYPGVAYIKYVPSNNSCQVNEGYCHMMRKHPEEVMVRARESDFCHSLTDVDALCNLIDNIQLTTHPCQGEARIVTRYFALSRSFQKQPQPDVEPVLVQMTIRLQFDQLGAMEVVEKWMRPISADDYNRALARTPHLCRPFAAAIADCRSGEELLATYEEERCKSMAELSRVPAIADRLRALARCFRHHAAKLLASPVAANATAPRSSEPSPWNDHAATVSQVTDTSHAAQPSAAGAVDADDAFDATVRVKSQDAAPDSGAHDGVALSGSGDAWGGALRLAEDSTDPTQADAECRAREGEEGFAGHLDWADEGGPGLEGSDASEFDVSGLFSSASGCEGDGLELLADILNAEGAGFFDQTAPPHTECQWSPAQIDGDLQVDLSAESDFALSPLSRLDDSDPGRTSMLECQWG